MLYPKKTENLSEELFSNPTSEYRGIPFWAWNCALDKEELLRQIEILREMGFGGFHMHVRSGMATEYLGEEFMDLVATCVDKAKQEQMSAWLYDEDRWPSGCAGGLVTKDAKYRMRYLRMTTVPYDIEWNGQTRRMHKGANSKLIGRYCVQLCEEGCLQSYRLLKEDEVGEGTIWYAYVESPPGHPRYNGYTYVNTMDKASVDRFIELTHEAYKRKVGVEFGETIPAIFTDEPQTTRKGQLKLATGTEDVLMPFTDNFEDTFRMAYGKSLVEHLPEIFWELPKNQVSQIRYWYHDHAAERFAEAFADTLGAWCDENGILLTGHVLEEPTLKSQASVLGEAMRSYRGFSMPGVDMLADYREYTTVKQAQSAVNQKGCEGLLDELYGVTSWDFDFRGHKLYGDWQAALGVSVRVPHLSWVSMEGEAKRDYPASINYQSPWYKEYRYVEDHFARVNTAMTRGVPVVRVGVIHPIESYWLHWGPVNQTETVREQLDHNFRNITEWLLFGGIDFDFICESTLPLYCEEGSVPLRVGKMAYDAILVPGCETLRTSTIERLEAFQQAGGTLIFVGEHPKYLDAVRSERPETLLEQSMSVPFEEGALLNVLEPFRTIELRSESGALCDHLLYRMREEKNGVRWIFIANGKELDDKDICVKENILINLPGSYSVKLFDTLSGEIKEISCQHEGGWTSISATIYQHDSLLYQLTPESELKGEVVSDEQGKTKKMKVPSRVSFTLDEPNVLVLDMARWAIDDNELEPKDEILRIDTTVRRRLGWMPWGGKSYQPWFLPKGEPSHTLHLKYEFESEIDYATPMLALENPADTKIWFNSKAVDVTPVGWYVDKSICTVKLPSIRKGLNTIEVTMPYGERTAAECMYLLGDFGVRVEGSTAVVTNLPETLTFGDIVHRGFPFYSGKITYHFSVETEEGILSVKVPRYRAALLRIHVDEESKPVAFSPYTTCFEVSAGEHKIAMDAYINRTNGFGPLHFCDTKATWIGPQCWRSSGEKWSYEYNFKEQGILSAPEINMEDESHVI